MTTTPPAHRFKLLAFDLDGTLVNSLGMIEQAINHAMAKNGQALIGGHSLREPIGLPLEDCVRYWIEGAGEEANGAGAGVGAEPEAFVPASALLVQQVTQDYRAHFRALRDSGAAAEPMFPHVFDTLDRLRAPDVFMAVVTGKDLPGLLRVIDHHRMAHYFDGNLNTPTHYAGKPSPQMVVGAATKAMQDLADTVVIGDTVFDIEMAQNAKVKSVGVSYGNHSVERLVGAGADIIIDDFAQLPQALADIS